MDLFELHMPLKKIDNATKICFLTASEMCYEEDLEKRNFED
jgi:hypothetical protein